MPGASLDDIGDVAVLGTPRSAVPTGVDELDRMHVLRESEVAVLCAPRGMGATTFGLTLAIRSARAGIPVAHFMLDLGRRPTLRRLLSIAARVPTQHLGTRKLVPSQRERVQEQAEALRGIPLSMETRFWRTTEEIRTRFTSLSLPPALVILDSLDTVAAASQDEALSELMTMARASGVAWLVLARSEAGETPDPWDLRRLPLAVRRLAPTVFVLHRPMYYSVHAAWDVAEFHVVRNDNGPVGQARTKWNHELSMFSDLPP